MGRVFNDLAKLVAGGHGRRSNRCFPTVALVDATVFVHKTDAVSRGGGLAANARCPRLAPVSEHHSLRVGVFRAGAASVGSVAIWQTWSHHFDFFNVGDRHLGHITRPGPVRGGKAE